MPPPTSTESWLYARRFGIVIDAGSSGSRLQIYSWRDATVVRQLEGEESYNHLPKVEKGTQNPNDWVYKVEPGATHSFEMLELPWSNGLGLFWYQAFRHSPRTPKACPSIYSRS